MVKRQNDSRAEQPRLVIQTAGQCDEVGVLGVDGLSEYRRGPRRLRSTSARSRARRLVPSSRSTTATSSDLDARKVTGEGRRHPFRADCIPSLRDGQLGNGHLLTSGSCRRRPAASTPVM